MTFLNESSRDRGVRAIVGVLLLVAGWGFASGTLAAVLITLGAIAIGTGIVGWCPAYTACGLSTRHITTVHRPAEDAGHQ